MFVLEAFRRRAVRALRPIHGLVVAGVLIMTVAFIADLVPPAADPHGHAGHVAPHHDAHVAVLVGMTVVLAGIGLDARRHHLRSGRTRSRQRRSPNAHR